MISYKKWYDIISLKIDITFIFTHIYNEFTANNNNKSCQKTTQLAGKADRIRKQSLNIKD